MEIEDTLDVTKGKLVATGMIQNAIVTYLLQSNPNAAMQVAQYVQLQYDALPGSLSGELNAGIQARLAEFRQALALP